MSEAVSEFRVETAADREKQQRTMRSPAGNQNSNSLVRMSGQPQPIEVVYSGKQHDESPDMRVVPFRPKSPEFELPDGWVVEVRPRGPTSSVLADKVFLLLYFQ